MGRGHRLAKGLYFCWQLWPELLQRVVSPSISIKAIGKFLSVMQLVIAAHPSNIFLPLTQALDVVHGQGVSSRHASGSRYECGAYHSQNLLHGSHRFGANAARRDKLLKYR